MRLFADINVDWLGKTKYFVAGSLLMLLIGWGAWYKHGGRNGGLRLGIDFRGGTLVYVRFAHTPPVDQIRAALAAQGLRAEIQQVRDFARGDVNEVIIGLEQHGEGEEEALDAGKNRILEALRGAFGGTVAGKQDLNAANLQVLADHLIRRDPLGLGPTAAENYGQLAQRMLQFRDRQRSGLLTSFDELKQAEGVTDPVVAAVQDGFFLGAFAVRNVEIVGPKVGAQLRTQAFWATVYALIGMLVYIAFRFEWVYGAAAVVAVIHDVLVTLGFFALFRFEISLTVIAALLTLVGYSMNDTIVIFDRMRENLRLMRREPLGVIANRSINQTLSRTILTSGLTFLVVVVLFIWGGDALRAFSFALVVGVVVGSYSTVGIAAAVVVAWANWRGQHALVSANSARKRLAAAGRR